MEVESGHHSEFKGWNLDPFEELQRLWSAINDGARLGVPHVVGRVSVRDGMVSGLEMSVILHEKPQELAFRQEGDVYFMIPAKPEEGIEGIYVKLNGILRDLE